MRKFGLVLTAVVAAIVVPIALAQQRGTGLVWLEPERYRSIPLAPPVGISGVPAEFDLSRDFPTPGDQGPQGSCVGWAVGYALKSFQERRERSWTNWDDTKRMSPAFVYNQIKVAGCGEGARIADGLGLLSSDGSASWADQPYKTEECESLPSALTKQNAAMNRIAGWFRVNPQDITVVKAHVAAGMPLLIGMAVDQSFQALEAGEIWNEVLEPNAMGHAMVVVGYSDKRKAVKVINSWGTGWGDGGFGWIDYEAFRRAVREAYVAQDIVLPVGVAERREIPYISPRGGSGPAFFGLQLGMSKAEAEGRATRPISKRTTGDQGFTTTTFEVRPSDGTSLSRAWFSFEDRHDYLKSMTLHFTSGSSYSPIKAPEFQKAAPELGAAFVAAARRTRRAYDDRWYWEVADPEAIWARLMPSLSGSGIMAQLPDDRLQVALDHIGVREIILDALAHAKASPVRSDNSIGSLEYGTAVKHVAGNYTVHVNSELYTNRREELDCSRLGCSLKEAAPSTARAEIVVRIEAATRDGAPFE